MTWAPSRAGSPLPKYCIMYWLVRTVRAEPMQTRTWVRNPAVLPFLPRSMPMTPPQKMARQRRTRMETQLTSRSSGAHWAENWMADITHNLFPGGYFPALIKISTPRQPEATGAVSSGGG